MKSAEKPQTAEVAKPLIFGERLLKNQIQSDRNIGWRALARRFILNCFVVAEISSLLRVRPMALIRAFDFKHMDRNSIHDDVNASYSTFERDGRRFIQFDSYGRDIRDFPGKKSQTFQLDETSAHEMFKILKKHFGF